MVRSIKVTRLGPGDTALAVSASERIKSAQTTGEVVLSFLEQQDHFPLLPSRRANRLGLPWRMNRSKSTTRKPCSFFMRSASPRPTIGGAWLGRSSTASSGWLRANVNALRRQDGSRAKQLSSVERHVTGGFSGASAGRPDTPAG